MIKRICTYIDRANFYGGLTSINKKFTDTKFDFEKYITNLVGPEELVQVYYYNAIVSLSKVAELNPQLAKKAGIFHAEIREKIKDFRFVDSLILTLAKELNAKIITGDEHFRGFKEAIMIK
jgi:predicted nucleic acid-binding protein